MSLLLILFQNTLGFARKNSIVLSVLLSAGLFSAYHHISAPVNWVEFGFRTVAGVYFSILFAIRGFGITAGTHAFYDIIATIINAVFFQQ
jgi:membrane protease YdiL (CAAX protease family)